MSFYSDPKYRYHIGTELNVARLERVGLVAIGREFNDDVCIGTLGLYK
ncbi:hypothetical protein [Thiohalophilus sp.]|nr:hypothetical protein [Thiohalophilus sp.]MDZ7804964.1 hypothetical protein [Thiohalophilus sp.]